MNPTPKLTDSPTTKPTTNPTSPPSSPPSKIQAIITPPPSPAPTTCEERKWYTLTTDNQLICSNGDDVPPGWAGSEFYYDSVEACCMSAFGSIESCEYINVCVQPIVTPVPTSSPTSNPTANPTSQPSALPTPCPTTNNSTSQPSSPPTSSPVTPSPVENIVTPPPSPAPTTCEERKWQVMLSADNLLICSNGVNAEATGSEEIYDNLLECCEAEFGESSCMFDDTCVTPAPVTPAPTPCVDMVFYFVGNSCTNEIQSNAGGDVSYSKLAKHCIH
jgi:hypothetical protein